MSARPGDRALDPAHRARALQAIRERRHREHPATPRSRRQLAERRLRAAADTVICVRSHAQALERSRPAAASAAARLAREAERLGELCASLTTPGDPRGRFAAVLAEHAASRPSEDAQRRDEPEGLVDALERLCDLEMLNDAEDNAARAESTAERRARVAIADRAITLTDAVLTLQATRPAATTTGREPRTAPEQLARAVRVVLREQRTRRSTKPTDAAVTPLPSRAPQPARALAA
jgi:hypothetical protein